MTDKTAGMAGRASSATILGIGGATAVIAVIADQASKAWALGSLTPGEAKPIAGGFLSFFLLHNPGAAFSFGEGKTVAFTVLSVVIVGAIIWWFVTGRVHRKAEAFLIALVAGGAIGNLIDRLVRPPGFGRGHVVDFIDYNGWFVGNVADIWIVGGAIAAVLYFLVRGEAPEASEDSGV